MTAVLDLHDTALKIWRDDTDIESPGYVWFDGKQLRFGLAAVRTQRRTPREVNTRFWSQLGTAPLAPPLGKARHTADLAHEHLQTLYEEANRPDRVLLAVPGSFTREQLSLLLGIVEHLPFSIDGLIHRSALLASASGMGQGLHVELQLHQTLVTQFQVSDGHVAATNSQALPGEGLLALQDRLANSIAGAFVDQTRFDPLRSADGEQTLYDQLPVFLATLKTQGEAHMSINGYDVRVTQEDLASVGTAYANSLQPLLDADSPILLESPLDQLPGLVIDGSAAAIDNGTIVTTTLKFADSLRQAPDALVLQRRVPAESTTAVVASRTESPAPATESQQANSLPRPTHWVSAGVAKAFTPGALSPQGIQLEQQGTSIILTAPIPQNLNINGQAAEVGHVFTVGDVITDAMGFNAQLIAVEE
jgi:hypothetical protein